jgi:hypothetical protein
LVVNHLEEFGNDFGVLCHYMAMRRRLALLAAVLLVVVSFGLAVNLVPPNTYGDFPMLWTGARLLGPDLYDWQKAAVIWHATRGGTEVFGFVRLPTEAFILWPLAQLPIDTGFRIWQIVNLCALLAFVWTWSPKPVSFLAAALFVPIWWAIGIGQDSCILLLLAGAGVRLIQRGKPFAGGFMLALCVFKPHLFLFLPVVLIAQRRWKAVGGMLTCGAVVYALSSIIVGPDWPAKFLASVAINRQSFQLFGPGLSYAFTALKSPAWAIVATEAVIALLVYRVTRREPWITAAVCTLTAGVLLAPWSYWYDLSLVLPLVLSALSGELDAPGIRLSVGSHSPASRLPSVGVHAPEGWEPGAYGRAG